MKISHLLPVAVFAILLASCGTGKKLPAYYLDHVKDTTKKEAFRVPEMRIQNDDQLSIQVYSATTRPEADLLYNLPTAGGTASGGNNGATGFLVDANGNIEYPRLGTIHAAGLTKQELAAEIKKRLTEPVVLLNNPNVIIRFLNYKITVLGEVAHQGVLTVPGEKVTIMEALGLAGGITDGGKKDVVKVVREIDGQRQVGMVNVSSDSVFNSQYYYLAQNDLVIVEPTKQKARQIDQSMAMQRVTFALSVITAAAFLYNIFK